MFKYEKFEVCTIIGNTENALGTHDLEVGEKVFVIEQHGACSEYPDHYEVIDSMGATFWVEEKDLERSETLQEFKLKQELEKAKKLLSGAHDMLDNVHCGDTDIAQEIHKYLWSKEEK